MSFSGILRTGIRALDEALGRGGFPRGKVIEIFGPEACGKTTLALHLVAQTQAAGGTALFIDADHAFDPGYAHRLGVVTESLLLSQPASGDQAIQMAAGLLRTFALDLIVVDSVAALSPEQDDGDAEAAVTLHGELVSRGLRKLFWLAARSDASLVLLNHGRTRTPADGNDSDLGGHSVALYSSLRLRMAILAEDAKGSRVRVRVVKNRLWESWPEVDLYLRYGSGFGSEPSIPRKPARPETETTDPVLSGKAHSTRG
jgi:recombination protein RecA